MVGLLLGTRARASEAGALPLEVRIENYSDQKSTFFHSFSETTLLHVSCDPVHCEPKIYFRFFEVCTYPLKHNWTSGSPPCYAISEGRPSLRTRARKRELYL